MLSLFLSLSKLTRTAAGFAVLSLAVFSSAQSALAAEGTIDPVYRFAWGENIGWIDFGTEGGNVLVTDDNLSGFAYGENIGWISLNCTNDDSCGTVSYGVVNDGDGALSGFAYGENIGWIDFMPAGAGVTIDSNGVFHGAAYGENIGWIIFNCVETLSCGDIDYKVVTSWRPDTGEEPTPTPTPTPSPSPSGSVGLGPWLNPTTTPVPSHPAPQEFLSMYNLNEGDTVSVGGSDDPDVYIVNEHGYKRLLLNPIIFNFYGHLTGGFQGVKSIASEIRDVFPTSNLFRNCESGDLGVNVLEVTGEDTGTLRWINMTGDQAVQQDPDFFKKVFCINNNEFNWYSKSTATYTSLDQIPLYKREQ